MKTMQLNLLKMKLGHIAILVILVVISLINNLANAQPQNTTAQITLSAFVNELVSISITPIGNYSNLNISKTQVDIPVATVYESSNSSNGYLVKARSENNGKIQSSSSEDNVPYILRYGGRSAIKLTNSDQTMREQVIGGTYSSINQNVTISFLGIPEANLKSGTYNDVITFTIESK